MCVLMNTCLASLWFGQRFFNEHSWTIFERKIITISLPISLNICFVLKTVSLSRFFYVPTTYVLVEK